MPYTVTECADFIGISLGGRPDARLSTLSIVNLAGTHFVGMSAWRFMVRKASFLATVAAQTYVVPPADFGAIISLTGAGATGIYYQPSSLDVINILRQAGEATGTPYLYAVVDTTPSGSTAAVRHIELHPTPSDSVAQAISLVYRAQWANLTSDSSYIPFPDYTKTLFMRVCATFARGLMEEDKGTLSARLAELDICPEKVNAVKQDRAMQQDRGVLRGDISDYYAESGRITLDITGP